MRAQILHETLRRLRQPKDRPEVHSQRCDERCSRESLELGCCDLTRSPYECNKHQYEQKECEDLKGEASEKNVVWRCGVLAVTVRDANHCCAGDLNNRCNHIADDEDPQNEL